jgi:hypothetical protein
MTPCWAPAATAGPRDDGGQQGPGPRGRVRCPVVHTLTHLLRIPDLYHILALGYGRDAREVGIWPAQVSLRPFSRMAAPVKMLTNQFPSFNTAIWNMQYRLGMGTVSTPRPAHR